MNEVVFDDDATVSHIDFDTDDSEVWQSINNEMSFDETFSEEGEHNNDADESAFNDIKSQISDMESDEEDVPVAEITHNSGGHRLRDRSTRKKLDFVLHLSVEAAIQKLDKAASKSIVKEIYQLD